MVVVNYFSLLYAFFLRPHCTGLAGLPLIEIKFYDVDNSEDDILSILCKREPASFRREKIAIVILLRVVETFKFKTRTTTRARFFQYLLVRTREPASFWRTNALAVVIFSLVLARISQWRKHVNKYQKFYHFIRRGLNLLQ